MLPFSEVWTSSASEHTLGEEENHRLSFVASPSRTPSIMPARTSPTTSVEPELIITARSNPPSPVIGRFESNAHELEPGAPLSQQASNFSEEKEAIGTNPIAVHQDSTALDDLSIRAVKSLAGTPAATTASDNEQAAGTSRSLSPDPTQNKLQSLQVPTSSSFSEATSSNVSLPSTLPANAEHGSSSTAMPPLYNQESVLVAAGRHSQRKRPSVVTTIPPLLDDEELSAASQKTAVLGGVQVTSDLVRQQGGIPLSLSSPRQSVPPPSSAASHSPSQVQSEDAPAEKGRMARPSVSRAEAGERRSAFIDALRMNPPSPSRLLRRSATAPPRSKQPRFAPAPLDTSAASQASLRDSVVSTPYPPSGRRISFRPLSRRGHKRERSFFGPRSPQVQAAKRTTASGVSASNRSRRKAIGFTILLQRSQGALSKAGRIALPTIARTRGDQLVDLIEEHDDEDFARLVSNCIFRGRGLLRSVLSMRQSGSVQCIAPPCHGHLVHPLSAADDRTSVRMSYMTGPDRLWTWAEHGLERNTDDAHPFGHHFATSSMHVDTGDQLAMRLADLIHRPSSGRGQRTVVDGLSIRMARSAPYGASTQSKSTADFTLVVRSRWCIWRIIFALLVVMLCSVAAMALWVCLGLGGEQELVYHRDPIGPDGTPQLTATSLRELGWRNAGGRVGTGALLAGLTLLVGWTGVAGWAWVSWALD